MSYALDGGRGQHGPRCAGGTAPGSHLYSFTQVLEHAPGARKSDKTFAQVPLDKARNTRPRMRTWRCGCGWF